MTYPESVGVEIHEEGIAEVYVWVSGEEEKVVFVDHHLGTVSGYYLVLTVRVGVRYYSGCKFVGYHFIFFPFFFYKMDNMLYGLGITIRILSYQPCTL